MGRTPGKEVCCYIAPYRSSGWHRGRIFVVATLYTASILLPSNAKGVRESSLDVTGEEDLMNIKPHYALPAAGLAIGVMLTTALRAQSTPHLMWWPKWQFTMLMLSPGIMLRR